jgi:signal transduction histidine kinase
LPQVTRAAAGKGNNEPVRTWDRAVAGGAGPDGLGVLPVALGVSSVGLGVLSAVEVLVRQGAFATNPSTALLLALGGTVPLALVATHPRPAALAIASASAFLLVTFGQLPGAAVVALAVTGHLLGRARSWWVAAPVAVALAFAMLALLRGGFPAAGGAAAAVAAAAGLGAARGARARAAARDDSLRAAEETLVAYAARGERVRIARELHDVVAHHISMISVQAETARLATPGMPADGAKRLLAIGDTARAALTEMRRLLGVLREDSGEAPDRRPQPGLDQLNDLLDEARDAGGASTRLLVCGPVSALEPGVELTAYRIVQEALTNTRRHAPGAAVDVELAYGPGELRVRIRDNGPGPGGDRVGHGLLGMRERVAALGGEVSAGPASVGGFLVEAVLPLTLSTVEGVG